MTYSARAALTALALTLLLAGCQNNPQGYRTEGDYYYTCELYGQAADCYGKYLEIKPGEPYVRGQYGRSLLKSGHPKEASQQLAICILEDPNDDALDDYCEALAQSGQYDELHRTLRTYAGDRGSARDYLRYGKYALQMGDADAAKTAFITSARLDGGRTPDAHLALYEYYMSVNQPAPDKAMAVRHLRMAYAIAPKNPKVQSAVAKSGEVPGPTFGMRPSVEGEQ